MAEPVTVGIDMSTLLFLGLGVGSVLGLVAYINFKQYIFGKQIKNELRGELLDKEHTKEIKRIDREIDKIENQISKTGGGKQ